jgi:DNA polymerase-1
VPLAHDYPGAPDQLNREQVLEQLRPLLQSPDHLKVGQHLKYDWHVLANHGVTLRGIQHDTLLESYVLDSTAQHNMDSAGGTAFEPAHDPLRGCGGERRQAVDFNQVPLEQAGPYAAEDADVTLRLHHCLWPQVGGGSRAYSACMTALEIPLIRGAGRHGARRGAGGCSGVAPAKR